MLAEMLAAGSGEAETSGEYFEYEAKAGVIPVIPCKKKAKGLIFYNTQTSPLASNSNKGVFGTTLYIREGGTISGVTLTFNANNITFSKELTSQNCTYAGWIWYE